MRRLLRSYKFWCATVGSVLAVIAAKITGETSVALAILGLYTTVIGGGAIENVYKVKNRNNANNGSTH